MHKPIQVLIVDDEPRLRAAWQRVVAGEPDMMLVALLASADELSAHLPEEPSVVLLDLSMPGRDPLEVASHIRDLKPQCRIVIYSGYSDSDTLQEAMDAGAWGLVDKLAPIPSILDVIRRVAAGEAVFGAGSPRI